MSVPDQPAGLLLDQAAAAPPIALDELSPPGGLLVVVPHSDDETLGCGMALSAAAAAGRQVFLALLTDGEGSHPGSPSVGPDALRTLRAHEFDRAVAILLDGPPAHLERLGLPDGRSHAAMLPPARLEALADTARALGVRAVWSSWRGDPHCDHETAAHLADAVAERLRVPLWEYAVWGRFGVPAVPARRLYRFHAPEHAEAKRRALACHASQFTDLIADDPAAFRMPLALLAHFRDAPELFLRG